MLSLILKILGIIVLTASIISFIYVLRIMMVTMRNLKNTPKEKSGPINWDEITEGQKIAEKIFKYENKCSSCEDEKEGENSGKKEES